MDVINEINNMSDEEKQKLLISAFFAEDDSFDPGGVNLDVTGNATQITEEEWLELGESSPYDYDFSNVIEYRKLRKKWADEEKAKNSNDDKSIIANAFWEDTFE